MRHVSIKSEFKIVVYGARDRYEERGGKTKARALQIFQRLEDMMTMTKEASERVREIEKLRDEIATANAGANFMIIKLNCLSCSKMKKHC